MMPPRTANGLDGFPNPYEFSRNLRGSLRLTSLRKENHVETVQMEFESGDCIVADVYGREDENGGWYIKLHVEHGRVQVMSCHAPKHDLMCCDGTRIPKG
jgi:hypothetical protein